MRAFNVRLVPLIGVLRVAVAGAQNVGGQVVTDHNAPLRATVQLVDSARVVVDSTVSDSGGAFYLMAPHVGQYVLRVAGAGLQAAYTLPFTVALNEFHQERIVVATVPNTRVYVAREVQQSAAPARSNTPPPYPPSLRDRRLEGTVLLQFVVDSSGRIVMGTAKVLKSAHPDFTNAVFQALPSLRFYPASLNGRPVAELVQMPFEFRLPRDSAIARRQPNER